MPVHPLVLLQDCFWLASASSRRFADSGSCFAPIEAVKLILEELCPTRCSTNETLDGHPSLTVTSLRMIKMLLRSNKISLAGLRASRMIFEVGRLSKPGRRSGKVRFRRLERTRIFERPFIILRRTDPSGLRIALPTPEIPGGLIA